MRLKHQAEFLGLFVTTVFAASSALCQAATNYTSVKASSGQATQLTYHATAHKNCAPAPPPTINVTQPPKAGMLIVRKAVLTTDKFAGCGRIRVPAQVVFYQSKEGYAGGDHISYEVTDADGNVTAYDVTITVEPVPNVTTPGKDVATPL